MEFSFRYEIDTNNFALENKFIVVWETIVGHWLHELGHSVFNFIDIVYGRNFDLRRLFVDWAPPTLPDENPALLGPVDWASLFRISGHYLMIWAHRHHLRA
jgi:hypothetical protein